MPHAETIADVPVLIATPAATRAPAVVWLHGFGADALANAAELERLAREGFVAVGVDAVGHGRRRRPDLDAIVALPRAGAFAAMLDFADATARELPALVAALRRRPDVQGPVGLVGVSMGAFAAYRALALGAPIDAAVALLGDPAWPGEPEALAALDPFARVPLLSITGERDESVPPDGARALHERLAAAFPGDARFRYRELTGAPHLMGAADWARAMDEAAGWLRRWLAQ